MTDKPNPGSDEAVALGCKCPRDDNGYGKGCGWGEGMFWINGECPVHGQPQPTEEKD